MKSLYLVKPGVETFCMQELAFFGQKANRVGPGLVASDSEAATDDAPPCFPFWRLIDPVEIINKTDGPRPSDTIDAWFREEIRELRLDAPWHLSWLVGGENGYMPSRPKEEKFLVLLKKRLSRISKLALLDSPMAGESATGLFVVEVSPDRFFVARQAVFFGQRRMRDDPAAPSRSFLKIEEAFAIMGICPGPGDLVADLGAAPGGWTWAAAKRGATVWAIDNGPLKGAVAEHKEVHHLMKDAYRWRPEKPLDWLFCDMIDAPETVLPNIRDFVEKKLCRFAVVNFKYGRTNPVAVLEDVRGSSRGLGGLVKKLECRHLFHDRDEFTAFIEV